MNPLDWTEAGFAAAYSLLFFAAIILGLILPRVLRPGGRPQPVADADSLAYLTGRNIRFAEGVTARLLAAGAIRIEDRRDFHRAAGADVGGSLASDRALLALPAPFGWGDILTTLRPEAARLEQRLVSGGLLLDAGERRRLALIAAAPYILLFGLGLLRLLVGMARGETVFLFAVLMFFTLFFGFIRWASVGDLTDAGRAALKDARRRHARLKRAPTPRETDLAVALFGPAVLAGSALDAFHQLRRPSDSDSGGGGDSSSGNSGCSGCSGCGGGGGD